MALHSCRECEEKVSTEADTCPHCGCPDPTRMTEEKRHARRLESYDLGTSDSNGEGEGSPERIQGLKQVWSRLPRLLQLTVYAVVITTVFLIPAVIFGPDDATTGGSAVTTGSRAGGSYAGEVSDGRSFGEVIAAEMTGSLSPRSSLVKRFNGLINGISQECSRSRQWVSDRILSGHQALQRRGGAASLLDVAEGWREAVRGVDVDCEQVLATLLVMLERG